MAQITGKKVAVTPMPTPSGASGAIIDSFNTQDDKTVNAPSIHIVEDAITTINDNLSKNTIDSSIVIALTDDVDYTTLADGYFRIACNGSANNWVKGNIDGINVMTVLSTSTQSTSALGSVFVRKGSVISYHGTANASTGAFYPLT